ncbi:hypothetical protein HDE_09060 [Halotydeus destructor]|nr:hypothetical protein HDE_09060 [Halotydeus destructor]
MRTISSVLRLKAMGRILLLASSLLISTISAQNSISEDDVASSLPSGGDTFCADGYATFELTTGQVYSAESDETIQTLPGTLQLTDCIGKCRDDPQCRSMNFETGLCVLFRTSANEKPAGLQPSQFPVFTTYAQKVCLAADVKSRCDRMWTFERVPGYELRKYSKKRSTVTGRIQCMELCLKESDFDCRSFNFDVDSKECILSDMDRHTLSPGPGSSSRSREEKFLLPSANGTTDYFESNCVQEPNKLCDFKQTKGKLLKTVDSVYQDISTVEECKEKCINSAYRCFSFDFGDPSTPVCRTSHLDKASLTHIEEPYLQVDDAVTYELTSCYNVTIVCKAREMTAIVKTSKLFNGKIYAKSKPNSCVSDISNTLDFEIVMPFHDVMCGVSQSAPGTFSNDIIIQHHDMIVTTQDLGLSVHCNYDLSNRSVSNAPLEVDGDVEDREGGDTYVHSSVVTGPNVTMLITDRDGRDIQAAQVGDALSLRFEILEKSSPYEIFVRDLVAVDGVDSSEITLIDSDGCPTDPTLMSVVTKVNANTKTLEATFEAFKFPTSNVVQFRAVVTPCLFACQPVKCDLSSSGHSKEVDSLGRRRRRSAGHGQPGGRKGHPAGKNAQEEEVVVAGAIKITDVFNFRDGKGSDLEELPLLGSGSCADRAGLIMAFCVFLFAQLVLLVAWYYMWRRIRENRHMMAKQAMYGHFFNAQLPPTPMTMGTGHGPCSVSSTEQLTNHFKKQGKFTHGSHLSVYDM